MPYILKKEVATPCFIDSSGYELSFIAIIPDNKIEEFITLHTNAKGEIGQEINDFTANSLLNRSPFWDNSLRFCLVEKDNVLIGYGYGHNEYSQANAYYINTIFIENTHRGKNISNLILMKFIEYFSENKSYKELHAVTQENNIAAIELLKKNNFEFQQDLNTNN